MDLLSQSIIQVDQNPKGPKYPRYGVCRLSELGSVVSVWDIYIYMSYSGCGKERLAKQHNVNSTPGFGTSHKGIPGLLKNKQDHAGLVERNVDDVVQQP